MTCPNRPSYDSVQATFSESARSVIARCPVATGVSGASAVLTMDDHEAASRTIGELLVVESRETVLCGDTEPLKVVATTMTLPNMKVHNVNFLSCAIRAAIS